MIARVPDAVRPGSGRARNATPGVRFGGRSGTGLRWRRHGTPVRVVRIDRAASM